MSEFTLNRNFTLISKTGHVILFKKGQATWVPPEVRKEAIQIGAQPSDGNTDVLEEETVVIPLSAGERAEKLIEAFKTLQQRNNRTDFTGQGIPAIPALKKLVEFDVEKKEVETLWNAYREEQGQEQ